MKFSLILATIGRSVEVEAFLRSLDGQTYREIQLIVVDQNQDDRVRCLLPAHAQSYEILYVHSSPGLSAARNVGLRHVTGDVVAFPDDDCWYAPGLLQQVHDILAEDGSIDGVTGRSVDESFRESGGSFAKKNGVVDVYRVWSQAISYTIFVRRRVCDFVGDFDETLGVGSNTEFGSGEETDYLIRAIKGGKQLVYRSQLTVHHPNKSAKVDKQLIEKALKYGAGMGRVLAKHHYPLSYRIRVVVRPSLGCVLAVVQGRLMLARLRLASAMGRLRGMATHC